MSGLAKGMQVACEPALTAVGPHTMHKWVKRAAFSEAGAHLHCWANFCCRMSLVIIMQHSFVDTSPFLDLP